MTSSAFGAIKTATVSGATLAYRERGEGEPVVCKCSPRPVLTRSLRRASLPIFGGLFVREVVGQSNGVRIRDCASGGFFEVLACIHPDELCRFDQAVVDRGYFSATLGL